MKAADFVLFLREGRDAKLLATKDLRFFLMGLHLIVLLSSCSKRNCVTMEGRLKEMLEHEADLKGVGLAAVKCTGWGNWAFGLKRGTE